MRKFYEAIVDHKKTVIVFFTIAMIISALCSTMVNVNYDINDYLPDGTASTVALDKMNEEYDMSIPNARVMVSGQIRYHNSRIWYTHVIFFVHFVKSNC